MDAIRKDVAAFAVRPNLTDYEAERKRFSWDAARAVLDGLPGGQGLNIAHEAVDRHASGPRAGKLALRWLGRNGETRDVSYAQLGELTSRFANALAGLGLGQGDRVYLLAGRIPELYVALLGALKHRCVVTPMFSAFGPEPIATRMNLGGAKLLVTTASLYRRKVEAIRAEIPTLEHVLLVRDEPSELPAGTLDLAALLAAADPGYTIGPTDPQAPALLHFTSGTTGKPKGALHVHEAVVAHHATGRLALDFHDDDVFWCTADPGWVTGTSYGIIAPLSNGITQIVDEADFDAERWYGILANERISVWYTAPTAVRMMMRAGAEAARRHDFPALRFIASVGEPLNPQAVTWGVEAFGLPIHDNWWQTETGGIMIANFAALDIRPGSMGKPLPGIDAAIVRRLPAGEGEAGAGEAAGAVARAGGASQPGPRVEVLTEPGVEGELALRRGWPSMFRAYLNQDERYARCFAGDWYLTGDLARRDEDGYFWFVGRADDMIKSSGHLIGPFEVESALMEHPAVHEAGVIGKPEPTVGEIVKAFVALKAGFEAGEPLRRELLGFARKRLGSAVAPKEIDFVASLPKTRSGKIMRRLLKARELGLPEGDTSTLEST
ncbi:acetate--CoA ligase [Burkholderiaceae bacterium FT117]|uniref:acetate--CoA ligase n=1 Tax=Zeimonas sediminis TaxID=2944268 RepID=UPI002342DB09|nr:acetate--CoA ligase [Zeimonas sediminis]MCM5571275.1 acetate--CoA ligase [Zeimonas sediminis]